MNTTRPVWKHYLEAGALALVLVVTSAAAAGAATAAPDAQYTRGLQLAGNKDYRAARATFQAAVIATPDHPYAGAMMRLMERAKANKIAPDAAQLVVEGLVAERAGNPQAAVERIARAATLAPGDANVQYLLGVVYQRGVKDDAKALAAYRSATELDAAYEGAYLAMADILSSRGDCTQAIDQCTRVIKLNDRSARAFLTRGKAYQTNGELDKAAADFERSIQIHPAAESYRLLAVVYEKTGRTKEAAAARAAADKLEENAGLKKKP
jgi:tetratricopeptide (TPR) repeat protein